MPGEQLAEGGGISRYVCFEEGDVVTLPAMVVGGTRTHDLTVMSVISPRNPPSTWGSRVSQTSR